MGVGVCRSEGEDVSTGSQDGTQRGASGAWRSRGGGEAGGALVCQPRLHGGGGRDVQSRGKGGEDWGQVTGANPAGGSEVVEQGGRLRMGRLDVSLPFPSEAQHREVPDEREGGLPDVVTMFTSRVPLGGKLLYRDFQIRLASALHKKV